VIANLEHFIISSPFMRLVQLDLPYQHYDALATGQMDNFCKIIGWRLVAGAEETSSGLMSWSLRACGLEQSKPSSRKAETGAQMVPARLGEPVWW
jgi:hypothetical protein